MTIGAVGTKIGQKINFSLENFFKNFWGLGGGFDSQSLATRRGYVILALLSQNCKYRGKLTFDHLISEL